MASDQNQYPRGTPLFYPFYFALDPPYTVYAALVSLATTTPNYCHDLPSFKTWSLSSASFTTVVLSRLWAQKGTRPRVIRQQQFMYQYIFGAVCPEEKKAAAIIALSANAASMQLHLEEISFHVPAGKHAVVVMDRAVIKCLRYRKI